MHALPRRFSIALCFGLCLAALFFGVGATFAWDTEGPVRTDCLECHETVVTNWEQSAHGQASSDELFQEAWREGDNAPECMACHTTGYDPEAQSWEAEGIHCAVCHSGQTGPHPEVPMPTDPSSRLCGTCHVDTYSEWEVSAHGQGEMACVRCHNPHTTALKVGGMQDLCMTCHNEEGHFYAYTGHAEQGLACTDCHLRVSDGPLREGHGQRQHTFAVDLETCNQCHSDEMHFPVQIEGALEGAPSPILAAYTPADEQACIYNGTLMTEEPATPAPKPWGYLLVAAASAGMGVAVAPWAEGWYRRFNGRS